MSLPPSSLPDVSSVHPYLTSTPPSVYTVYTALRGFLFHTDQVLPYCCFVLRLFWVFRLIRQQVPEHEAHTTPLRFTTPACTML